MLVEQMRNAAFGRVNLKTILSYYPCEHVMPLEWKGYPEQSKGDAEGNSFCNLEGVALIVARNWKGFRLASTGNCPWNGREVGEDVLCHLG